MKFDFLMTWAFDEKCEFRTQGFINHRSVFPKRNSVDVAFERLAHLWRCTAWKWFRVQNPWWMLNHSITFRPWTAKPSAPRYGWLHFPFGCKRNRARPIIIIVRRKNSFPSLVDLLFSILEISEAIRLMYWVTTSHLISPKWIHRNCRQRVKWISDHWWTASMPSISI